MRAHRDAAPAIPTQRIRSATYRIHAADAPRTATDQTDYSGGDEAAARAGRTHWDGATGDLGDREAGYPLPSPSGHNPYGYAPVQGVPELAATDRPDREPLWPRLRWTLRRRPRRTIWDEATEYGQTRCSSRCPHSRDFEEQYHETCYEHLSNPIIGHRLATPGIAWLFTVHAPKALCTLHSRYVDTI